MGFYVRKSVRTGPLRFNLSKSGIGVSAGVPGFRIGAGPRGNFVHAGRGGVYYRASLGGGSRRRARPAAQSRWSVLELAPSGRGELVKQLNEAAQRVPWGWWALTSVIILLFVRPPVGLIVALAASPGVIWLILRDRARRSVVAFYDVTDDVATWFQRLVDATDSLNKVGRRWRISASGQVRTTHQFKVNSGVNTIVSRNSLAVSLAGPRRLKTNIAVPSLKVGISDQASVLCRSRMRTILAGQE